jgi:hypothetical protein
MHKPQLTKTPMKDSNQSSVISGLETFALILPAVALLAIMFGVFVSNGAVLANQSGEASRISADINESYFNDDAQQGSSDYLAQGMLDSRSDQSDTSTNNNDVEDNANTEADADTETTSSQEAGQCDSPYVVDDLRIDFDNDRQSVLKLQSFLKTFENFDYVNLNGSFDTATLRAVEAFQTRYAEDILEPWGYQPDEATGYVYITTKQKINEIYCDEQFSLSSSQQMEIREYRQKLNAWRAQGASFETPQYLAAYYAQTEEAPSADNNDTAGEPTTDDDDDEMVEGTSDDATTSDSDTGTTSASSSDDDSPGFFEWLFGSDDDDEAATTSTSSATTSDEAAEDSDGEVVVTEEPAEEAEETATSATTSATSSSATSGIDQLAAGIYTGVNGVINFLLSPTFLLVVLVVLILLLIATLIDTDKMDLEGPDDHDSEADRYDAEMGGSDEADEADSDDVADDEDTGSTPEESAAVSDENRASQDKDDAAKINTKQQNSPPSPDSSEADSDFGKNKDSGSN